MTGDWWTFLPECFCTVHFLWFEWFFSVSDPLSPCSLGASLPQTLSPSVCQEGSLRFSTPVVPFPPCWDSGPWLSGLYFSLISMWAGMNPGLPEWACSVRVGTDWLCTGLLPAESLRVLLQDCATHQSRFSEGPVFVQMAQHSQPWSLAERSPQSSLQNTERKSSTSQTLRWTSVPSAVGHLVWPLKWMFTDWRHREEMELCHGRPPSEDRSVRVKKELDIITGTGMYRMASNQCMTQCEEELKSENS